MPIAMALQSVSPFFSNDQWGILRVLLFVVGPIILSIGGFVWFLVNRQERQDITNIGRKVDEMQKDQAADRAKISAFEQQRFEDRLAYVSAVNEVKNAITLELSNLRVAVGRVEERTCTGAEMREAIIEGVRMAIRELKKGDS